MYENMPLEYNFCAKYLLSSGHVLIESIDQNNARIFTELGTLRSSSGSHKPETIRENDTNIKFPALERMGTMDR